MAKPPPAFLKKVAVSGPKGSAVAAKGPAGNVAVAAKKAPPAPPAAAMPAFKKGGKVKK